ncbi:MAG: ABC transporter permease, partial [Tannerella sp.]|nr:ABC transporter permease [Tannerella sp.]
MTDRFNSRLDRIYVTTQEDSNHQGPWRFSGVWNPNNEKHFVDLTEYQGIERKSLFRFMPDEAVRSDEDMFTASIIVTDTSFMQILDFKVIAGEHNLSNPENVLISEEFARRVFGDVEPLGKKLYYPNLGAEVTVTGIVAKPTTKSSIRFD